MLETVFCVTFGACCTYTTGGETVDLSACGRLSTILVADVYNNSSSLQPSYAPATSCAAATGKVKFADELAGACAVALAEIACASTVIQNVTVRVHVIGF